ncbi:hypothetical protein AGMMS50230_14180 [Spirochaetia bacterium]|nr:hypothetical protein AGMMS50230_14180 [Spirochaetia bacterium]
MIVTVLVIIVLAAGFPFFFLMAALAGDIFFILLCIFYPLAIATLICWNKRTKAVFIPLALTIITIGIAGGRILYNDYVRELTSIDERDMRLYQYIPFGYPPEGQKLARLDDTTVLTFKNLDPAVLPRMDGATALYPVYAAFAQALYPAPAKTEEPDKFNYYPGDNSSFTRCSGTGEAYDRLLKISEDETLPDIIFCARPSGAQLEKAAAAGMEFTLTPIGREAFVFFVNHRNPVNDITIESIKGIYSGTIKNWKKLGGKNQSIRPFQRPENSGSQTILEALMEGTPIVKPRMEEVAEGMGGMIRRVAGYRNFNNAIGYSFLFFASVMAPNDDIKILAVNGVVPSRETIRDGTYPFSQVFYAVTLAGEAKDEMAKIRQEYTRAFIDWILSDEGQTLIEKCGYTRL